MAIANAPSAVNQAAQSQLSPNQSPQLQLHDIHVPEQVSNLPVAPGWWILLALIIISTLWFYQKHKKDKQLNADKHQALIALKNNPSMSSKECISLLKWAAMQYFSRQQLAKLYGQNFQDFLLSQLPQKYQDDFTRLINAAFQKQYQAELETTPDMDRDCQQAATLWLTHALPPSVAINQGIEQPPTAKNTVESEKKQLRSQQSSALKTAASAKETTGVENNKELSA